MRLPIPLFLNMQYSLLHRFQGAFLSTLISTNFKPSRREQDLIEICLLSFDDLPQQRQFLTDILTDKISQDAMILLGYFLSLILTESLSIPLCIPQSIKYLGNSPLQEPLTQIHSYLQEGISLNQIISHLSEKNISGEIINIVLGFYCFLSAPEDFNLTLNRSNIYADKSDVKLLLLSSNSIAVILSGAYNTIAGIPLKWRLGKEDMIKQSDRLFAQWAGIYDNILTNSIPISATGG